MRELDRLGENLAILDREIAETALEDPDVFVMSYVKWTSAAALRTGTPVTWTMSEPCNVSVAAFVAIVATVARAALSVNA